MRAGRLRGCRRCASPRLACAPLGCIAASRAGSGRPSNSSHGRHHAPGDPREREIRGGLDSLPGEEMPPSRTVAVPAGRRAGRRPAADAGHDRQRPNLAAFHGQTLTLRAEDQQGATRGSTSSARPPRRPGRRRLRAAATPTARPQTITVRSRTGASRHAAHRAIGPLSKRWTPTGPGRRAVRDLPRAGARSTRRKKLVSVTLPPTTDAGRRRRRSLPDGAHAGASRAAPLFEMPDLSGRDPVPRRRRARRSRRTRSSPAAPNGGDGLVRRGGRG